LRCPEGFGRFPRLFRLLRAGRGIGQLGWVFVVDRFSGNGVIAAQPMGQIDIGAAARAEGAVFWVAVSGADRAAHAKSSASASRSRRRVNS